MAVQDRLFTVEEFYAFVNLPENADKRLELIEGVIYEMPPSSPKNSALAVRLARFLGNFVDEHDLGHVLGADGGYTLAPGTVRIPDVSFISKARAPELPERFDIPPDLVIEVISPSEKPRAVLDKIALYLRAGVRLVWAVYGEEKVVDVWQAAADGKMQVETFDLTGTLDGADVLPGFTLPVKEIFQGLA